MRYASFIEPSTPVRSRALSLSWLAFSALSGATFALVCPPTYCVPFAWVALAGLGYALDAELPPKGAMVPPPAGDVPRGLVIPRTWFDGGARGLAFGFGANLGLLRFVPRVIARFTPLPFAAGIALLVLLALAQGLPWGAAGVVRGALARARVPRPVAFALAVYAATFVPSIFPWTPAGGVTPWPAMVQLADAIGERGVSVLLALSAGLLAHAARTWSGPRGRSRALVCVGIAVALPLGMALHGRARMRTIEDLRDHAPTATIGLVDATVPATTRWEATAAAGILAELTSATIAAEHRGAELTIWPESAYPYILPRGGQAGPHGDERLLQHGVRGPLLVGLVTRDAKGDLYNSALGVRPDGSIASEYDKLHLLWFGEEVPLATELPWLRRTFARGLGMLPGEHPVLLDLGRVKAAALICFEDVLPEAGREASSVSPNLLVNLSNDAWFAGSEESEMHLQAAVMRAIETRRDLVRAVNLGPTSLVDASGRIRATYDVTVPGSLVVAVALLEGGPTIYARFGDWPWILACGAVTWIFASTKRRERRTTK